MIECLWPVTADLVHAAHVQRVNAGRRACIASAPGFPTGVFRCHRPGYYAGKWEGRSWGLFPDGATATITDVTEQIPALIDALFAIGPAGWPVTRIVLLEDGTLTALAAPARQTCTRHAYTVPVLWDACKGADVTNSVRPEHLWPFTGAKALAPHVAAAIVSEQAETVHLLA